MKFRWQSLSYWKESLLAPCRQQGDASQQQPAKVAEAHKRRAVGSLRVFFVAVRLDRVVNLENDDFLGKCVLFVIIKRNVICQDIGSVFGRMVKSIVWVRLSAFDQS